MSHLQFESVFVRFSALVMLLLLSFYFELIRCPRQRRNEICSPRRRCKKKTKDDDMTEEEEVKASAVLMCKNGSKLLSSL